jgi:hypothetical protein
MRRAAWFGALALLLAVCACRGDEAPFAQPTAVVHEPGEDVYLVAGSQPGADGAAAGYLAVVRPDGVVVDRAWLAHGQRGVELQAPRGLAVAGAVVWVADGSFLRRFACRTGAVLEAIAVPGAAVLHDVAVAPDGVAYCCGLRLGGGADGLGAAVWRVGAAGAVEVVAQGPDLGNPQALCATAAGLYLASADGGFRLLDGKGHATLLAKVEAGPLVGLARLPGREGQPPSWFACSAGEHGLYRFDLQGGAVPLPRSLPSPGRCAVDARRGRLLVPLQGAGRLEVLAP